MNHNRSGRRNLREQTFSGQDLRGKNFFSGADLRDAKFIRSNLQGVDFSDANIQGATFHGADLRGTIFSNASVDLNDQYPKVDFSNTDIRGADFTEATLINADFTGAKTGLSRSWKLVLTFVSLLLCLLSSFPTALVSTLSLYFFRRSRKSKALLTPLFIGLASVILTVVIRGILMEKRGLSAIQWHVWIGTAMIIIVALGAGISVITTESEGDFQGIVGPTIASVFILVLALADPSYLSDFDDSVKSILQLVPFAEKLSFDAPGALTVSLLGASLGAIFGVWFSGAAVSQEKNFHWLWKLYIRFAVYRGTLFNRSNLTGATFVGAKLRGANFKDAKITMTRWQNAQFLDRARVGNSYLKYPAVRQLVLGKSIKTKNFNGLELEGINLESVNLTGSSFVSSNLNQANLRSANLAQANLQQAKLDGADLTGANLTGACIHSWTISKATLLKDIDCDYVFFEEYSDKMAGRRRFPPQPKSFKFGDFEKIFRKDKGQFQVLARNDDNKEALLKTINQLTQERDYTILGFEMIDEDVLIKFDVPKDKDESGAQDDFQSTYQVEIEQGSKEDSLENITLKEVIFEALKMGAEMAGDRVVNIHGKNSAYNEYIEGNNAQRDYIENMSQDLSLAADQIQKLLAQIETSGEQNKSAQEIVAQSIAEKAKTNSDMREKLSTWGQALASSTANDIVKGVVKIACQSVGIPL